MVTLERGQKIVLHHIGRILRDNYEDNDSIMLSHKDPKVKQSPRRIGWIKKYIHRTLSSNEYNEENKQLFNELRDMYKENIRLRLKNEQLYSK